MIYCNTNNVTSHITQSTKNVGVLDFVTESKYAKEMEELIGRVTTDYSDCYIGVAKAIDMLPNEYSNLFKDKDKSGMLTASKVKNIKNTILLSSSTIAQDTSSNGTGNTSNDSTSGTTGTSNTSTTTQEDVTSTYKITKLFPDPSLTTFDGKTISSLSTGSDNGEVTATKKSGSSEEVTFTVKASSGALALADLDSHLLMPKPGEYLKGVQDTITEIQGNNSTDYYISQSALERLVSNIQIIGDRILRNRVTGSECVLSDKNGLAIVGNQIIKTDQPLVIQDNDHIYYNLSVISTLLNNNFLTNIDPYNLFLNNDQLPEESLFNVNNSTSNIQADETITMKDVNDKASYFGNLYDINLMTSGLDEVSEEYYVRGSDGKEYPIEMIVHFRYEMPNGNSSIDSLIKDFSVTKASSLLDSAPTNATDRYWWDENMGLDNAILSMMIGLNETSYVQSGYLVPSITILSPSQEVNASEIESQILDKIKLPTTYTDEFSGVTQSNFLTTLFNQKSGSGSFRHYGIIYPYKSSKSNPTGISTNDVSLTNYQNMYSVDGNGTIYQTINSNHALDFSDNKIMVDTASKVYDNTFKQDNKTVYYIDGYKFYYEGTDSNNSLYDKFVAVTPLKGSVKKVDTNQYTLVNKDGTYQLDNEVDYIYQHLSTGSYLNSTNPSDHDAMPAKFKAGDYINGGVVEDDTKANTIGDSVKEPGNMDAEAYPTIYLNKYDYAPQAGNNDIVYKPTNTSLTNSTIFYSGIDNSAVSSVIAHAEGQEDLSQLPQGAKVLIQGMNFVKSGNYLVSSPITSPSQVEAVENSLNDSGALKTTIQNMFKGTNINFSGRSVSFSNYITEAELGTGANIASTDKGILYDNGGTDVLSDEGTYSDKGSAKGVVIQIQTSNDIKYMIVDKTNSVYSLVTSSDELASGYLPDTDMFNDYLGLSLNSELFLGLQKATYTKMNDVQKLDREIEDTYLGVFEKSFWSWVQSILTTLLAYMIIMSWICYMIVNFGIGYAFFDMFRNPTRNPNSKGLDIIHIVSFGIFDLDRKINVSIFFIGNIMLFTALYVLNTYL